MNPLKTFARPIHRASLLGVLVVLLSMSPARGAGPALHDFGAFTSVPSPSDTGAVAPRLAATQGGGALLSWIEPRAGGGNAVRLAVYDGLKWQAPVTIAAGESLFVNRADFPTVCELAPGTLAAAWLQKTGAGHSHQALAAFSSDGGATWGAPVRIHDDTRGMEHGFVSLAPADARHVRAVWLDGHNLPEGVEEGMADMTLRSRLVGVDGSLGAEAEVDPRTCDCCPTAAVRTKSATLVAWRDRSAEEIRDMSLARFERGAWTAPTPLHDDLWKIEGCPVNGPALAAEDTRVAAAWYSAARDLPRVWVAFSRDEGRHFSPPIRVDLGAPMGRPSVALLPDGSAAVCWLEGEKSRGRVLARRVTRDGKAGEPLVVALTENLRGTGLPQMVNVRGGLLFAWTDPARPSHVSTARTGSGDLPAKRINWGRTTDPR